MTIYFTDPDEEPLFAASVEDTSTEDNKEEEDVQSRILASEFDGDLTDIPKHMLFGKEEYGAIFCLASDKGAFVRVCACKATDCNQDGHKTIWLTSEGIGKAGSYETVRLLMGSWALGFPWRSKRLI
jgi:hypothetical protein